MSDQYFTAVFRVSDKDAFREHLSAMSKSMFDDSVFPGAKVTGCGWCDAMTEADLFGEALDDAGIERPEIDL